MPAHGLGKLDVSRVLASPLYLYAEPWGRNMEKNPPQGRFVKKERVLLGLQDQTPRSSASGPRRQGPWRLAHGLRKTAFAPSQKPRGLSPLAQIKCPCTRTFRETSETPCSEFQNLSGDQTLLSHISIFTFRLFRSSSSCLGSHSGLRTTFGHHHT